MSKSVTKRVTIWWKLVMLLIVGVSVISGTEAGEFQPMEQRTAQGESISEPVYIYASQSGKPTFDQGDSGGNPFASALTDTLKSKTLTLGKFLHHIVALTEIKSQGRQRPDVQGASRLESWRISPRSPREKRVALIVVFSDYSASDGAKSLPGAARDLSRVGASFKKAGFAVQRVLDPHRAELRDILRKFADHSAASDVAAIYTTGHGVEVDGAVYLLPGDYPVLRGDTVLDQRAIRLTELGAAGHAKHINLIFYGGCRNNPFN